MTQKETIEAKEKNKEVLKQLVFCQLAVGKMGCPGAEVARYLGVTNSSVFKEIS